MHFAKNFAPSLGGIEFLSERSWELYIDKMRVFAHCVMLYTEATIRRALIVELEKLRAA